MFQTNRLTTEANVFWQAVLGNDVFSTQKPTQKIPLSKTDIKPTLSCGDNVRSALQQSNQAGPAKKRKLH